MCCTMRFIATAERNGKYRTHRLSWPSYLENVEHPAPFSSSFNNKPLNETMPALCSEARPQQKPAIAAPALTLVSCSASPIACHFFPALHRLSSWLSRSGSEQPPPLQPSSKTPFLRSMQTRQWCATWPLPNPKGGLPRETGQRTKLPFTHVVNSPGDDHICILLCLQNRNGGGDC